MALADPPVSAPALPSSSAPASGPAAPLSAASGAASARPARAQPGRIRRSGRIPTASFALLYTRSKVYVHPTPYARDNVPGVLALLRDEAAPVPVQALWLAFVPEASLPSRDDAFVHVRPGRADELESDYDATAWHDAVHSAFLSFYSAATRAASSAPILLRRPSGQAATPSPPAPGSSGPPGMGLNVGIGMGMGTDSVPLTLPLPADKYAFAFPLAAAEGLVLDQPNFSQWYGSIRVLFKYAHDATSGAAVQLPTIFYHDDESVRPQDLEFQSPQLTNATSSEPGTAARASGLPASRSSSHMSPHSTRASSHTRQRSLSTVDSSGRKSPAPTWGGDELAQVLKRYTNVFRSSLQPGLLLLSPGPEAMAHHGSPYYETDAIDRPAHRRGVWGRFTSPSPQNAGDQSASPLAARACSEPERYDAGLEDIYRLDPYFLWQSTRSLVLTRFANLTQSARQASQQVLGFSSMGDPPPEPCSPTPTRYAHSQPMSPQSAPDVSISFPMSGEPPRGGSSHSMSRWSATPSTSPVPGGRSLETRTSAPASQAGSPAIPETEGEHAKLPEPATGAGAGIGVGSGAGSNTGSGAGAKGMRTRMRDYLHIGLSPLTKPVQTFAQAGPVPMGPLTDAEWGRISQQGGVEFDSARTYLSRWARLVADAGERCRRSETSDLAEPDPSSSSAPDTKRPPGTGTAEGEINTYQDSSVYAEPGNIPSTTDEVDTEVGQLGVFELLARCPDVPLLPSSRSLAREQGPIALDEWESWFDPTSGQLGRSVRAVKQTIFARGIAPDVEGAPRQARQAIWPFLLGAVSWSSTRTQREEGWRTKSAEYFRFKRLWEDDPVLLKRDVVLDQRSLIRKDCLRTDRNHPLFRTSSDSPGRSCTPAPPKVMSASIIQEKEWSHAGNSGNQHVARLGEILLTYGFWEAHQAAVQAALDAGQPPPHLDPATFAYQPPAGDGKTQQSLGGYVQGMSDLCALVYIVCQGDEVATFWCFVHLMQRLAPNFFVDQFAITGQLLRLQRLLALMDPAFYAHLERADGLNLFFAYRWFLVGFRREFSAPDALKLWDCMLAAEFTPLARSHIVPRTQFPPDLDPKAPTGGSLRNLFSRLTGTAGDCTRLEQTASTGTRWCGSSSTSPTLSKHHLTGGSSQDPGPNSGSPLSDQSRVGLTSGFSLFVALAMMQSKRDVIMRDLFEFDEILAFINGLSRRLDVEEVIASAEKAARAAKVLFCVRDVVEGKLSLHPPASRSNAPHASADPAGPLPEPSAPSEEARRAVDIPRRAGADRFAGESGGQTYSSGSFSCSCPVFVQVTSGSGSVPGSGSSRLGLERDEDKEEEQQLEQDEEGHMILVPASSDGRYRRPSELGPSHGSERSEDGCPHRVWAVDEEDFVLGLEEARTEIVPHSVLSSSAVEPSKSSSHLASCGLASDHVPLPSAEEEELRAAQILARSKGATALCARIAEAEDLRELVL